MSHLGSQQRIDGTEYVEDIAVIAEELVRAAPVFLWESAVRDTVKKHEKLDRRPIFAAIYAANAKLNELPEPPKEVATRNH